MAWHDGYLEASFRGVTFFVKRATTTGGRNTVDHVFPRREETDTEDLGGLPKKFTISAYLLGDFYFAQRESFEEALNEGGVGILVHPYRGVFNVKVAGEFSAVEDSAEGRIIRYEIPFKVDSTQQLTVAGTDTKWFARKAKTDVLAAAKSNFLDIFSLAQAPANMIRDARDAMDKGLSAIDSAKRIAGSAADFKRQIENTRGRLEALTLNLEYIVDSFADLIDWGSYEISGRDQFREVRQVAEFVSTLIGEATSNSKSIYPSQQVQNLIQQQAIAVQIGMVADVPFTSDADAEEARDNIFWSMRAIMEDPTISDELYAALRDGMKAVYDEIEARILTLPRFRDCLLPEMTNTLELMWSLYGSLDNEQAFIDRNEIIHPGFVPANVALKIQVPDA